jgi:hypothetical protein
MPFSRLESIPHDILQHIAFLLAISSIDEGPRNLLYLLLTSSGIYRSLSVHNHPHLYANIFRTTFDVDDRLHSRLTDSTLATELLQRYRILYRSRRQETSAPMPGELWAAFHMVLEDEGRNGQHLAAAGFPKFVHSLVDGLRQPDEDQMDALSIWLLCLTLTHGKSPHLCRTPALPITLILSARKHHRDVRSHTRTAPPLTSFSNHAFSAYPLTENFGTSDVHQKSASSSLPRSPHTLDSVNGSKGGKITPDVPLETLLWSEAVNYSGAVIITTFALNEAVPLAIPPHLPPTRAIALATQRTGPTVEDFRFIASRRTPLFADVRRRFMSGLTPGAYIPGSIHTAMHDSELCRLLHASYGVPDLSAAKHGCIPGSLSGVWEGSFMVTFEFSSAAIVSDSRVVNAAF